METKELLLSALQVVGQVFKPIIQCVRVGRVVRIRTAGSVVGERHHRTGKGWGLDNI